MQPAFQHQICSAQSPEAPRYHSPCPQTSFMKFCSTVFLVRHFPMNSLPRHLRGQISGKLQMAVFKHSHQYGFSAMQWDIALPFPIKLDLSPGCSGYFQLFQFFKKVANLLKTVAPKCVQIEEAQPKIRVVLIFKVIACSTRGAMPVDVDGGGSRHWADGESSYKETDCSLLLHIFEPYD